MHSGPDVARRRLRMLPRAMARRRSAPGCSMRPASSCRCRSVAQSLRFPLGFCTRRARPARLSVWKLRERDVPPMPSRGGGDARIRADHDHTGAVGGAGAVQCRLQLRRAIHLLRQRSETGSVRAEIDRRRGAAILQQVVERLAAGGLLQAVDAAEAADCPAARSSACSPSITDVAISEFSIR